MCGGLSSPRRLEVVRVAPCPSIVDAASPGENSIREKMATETASSVTTMRDILNRDVSVAKIVIVGSIFALEVGVRGVRLNAPDIVAVGDYYGQDMPNNHGSHWQAFEDRGADVVVHPLPIPMQRRALQHRTWNASAASCIAPMTCRLPPRAILRMYANRAPVTVRMGIISTCGFPIIVSPGSIMLDEG